MGIVRKPISFFLVGVLIALAMAVPCSAQVSDCLSILTNGWGNRQYLTAAVGGDRVALVSVDDTAFRLTLGTLDGRKTAEYQVQLPTAAADCTVAGLYPLADGTTLLGVYEPVDTAAQTLSLYRVQDNGQVQRLLHRTCTGETPAERMANTALSTFTEQDGVVRFAVIANDVAQAYAYTDTGLEQGTSQSAADAVSAMVTTDGTIVLGGDELLMRDETHMTLGAERRIVTHLTQVGAGICYLDAFTLKVYYGSLIGEKWAEVFDLSETIARGNLTSLSFTEDGDVLLLQDGHTLTYLQVGGSTSLNGLLYRSPLCCVFVLLGLLCAWLILTAMTWYLLCARWQNYLPLAVRMGGLLAACMLLIGLLLSTWVVKPLVHDGILRQTEQILSAATALASQPYTVVSKEMPQQVTRGLSVLTTDAHAAVHSVLLEQNGDIWVVCADNGQLPNGSRAELEPYTSLILAQTAMQQGRTFGQTDDGLCLSLRQGERVLQITLTGGRFPMQLTQQTARMVRYLWAGVGLMWAVVMLALLLIGRRLRRMGTAMERLSDGDTAVRLTLHTGDELEGLAASFNGMARAAGRQACDRDRLIDAYRRFVPARILSLLGKTSILQVDKETFAARHMTAMLVWFTFPDRVYDHSTRDLFESINEVIERTAAVVARCGGTVFNFAYNSYDVVLQSDTAQAVRTAVAVQQEALAFNEQRQRDGQPTVTLRIAMDVGEVLIGIVGDETQMEPATISTCFTTARRLIGLAERVDAGILCTETVIAGAQDYGSRYLGKSRSGDETLRVYEIFDGDPYDMRRGKQMTGQRFSQGIFALYSHDFTRAKRIFLELVHDNPQDGGARYYLYLADRLEGQPEQEIVLEC